jgi:hypothetical protein
MEAALREKRIEYYRAKIVVSEQEYTELDRKASALDLAMEDRIVISRIKDDTLKHCDYLRYMLGLCEQQG